MSKNELKPTSHWISGDEDFPLLELLDHVLNRGLVVSGDVTISVANVDLLYLQIKLLVSSVETLNKRVPNRESNDSGDA